MAKRTIRCSLEGTAGDRGMNKWAVYSLKWYIAISLALLAAFGSYLWR
jgi:hypothetical protein